jgi:hypothetical protein
LAASRGQDVGQGAAGVEKIDGYHFAAKVRQADGFAGFAGQREIGNGIADRDCFFRWRDDSVRLARFADVAG